MKGLGCEPFFLGRRAGLEERLVGRAGFRFFRIQASGLMGKGVRGGLRFILNLGVGVFQALLTFFRVRPERVVLTGGYPALAPALAARLLGIPYFLLEFNRIPGRVNRYLAPYAREVELGYPLERGLKGRAVLTGVPLRRALLKVGRRDDGRTVLFLGGSQGATALNRAAIEVARGMPGLNLLILAGDRDYPGMVKGLKLNNVRSFPFLPDPTRLYELSSLAVSRAGGVGIAELASARVPMILVPFPYASDNHQYANARWIEENRAGVMLPQEKLSELPQLIDRLLSDPERLRELTEQAQRLIRSDGARLIAQRVIRC